MKSIKKLAIKSNQIKNHNTSGKGSVYTPAFIHTKETHLPPNSIFHVHSTPCTFFL